MGSPRQAIDPATGQMRDVQPNESVDSNNRIVGQSDDKQVKRDMDRQNDPGRSGE